jgi:hypothetical protein
VVVNVKEFVLVDVDGQLGPVRSVTRSKIDKYCRSALTNLSYFVNL